MWVAYANEIKVKVLKLVSGFYVWNWSDNFTSKCENLNHYYDEGEFVQSNICNELKDLVRQFL